MQINSHIPASLPDDPIQFLLRQALEIQIENSVDLIKCREEILSLLDQNFVLLAQLRASAVSPGGQSDDALVTHIRRFESFSDQLRADLRERREFWEAFKKRVFPPQNPS